MKHVLLPIDGSTRSLRTIDMVQQTYRPQDTEVTLLMVLPDQMHIDGQFARDRMARKAAQEEIYISWDDAVRRAYDRYHIVIDNFKSRQ